MNSPDFIICPLCNDPVDKLVYRYHLDGERAVLDKIREHNPDWATEDGACSRCVDYYHTEIILHNRMIPEIGPHFPIRTVDDYIILPTGLRLDADPRFTGKGVTICFVDSGFYPHPDLVQHKNRIREFVDFSDTAQSREHFKTPHSESWHGTMTSVICSGDGALSNGIYKGIASDAELVLLKVRDRNGRITTETMVKALEWISANHEKHHIRIVSMSIADDEPISYKLSEVDRLANELYVKGITIVAAVGNNEKAAIKPPANSPVVIAVGGIDDGNRLNGERALYHSSYGKTTDDIMKPELVAQAIWIAAPILPGTPEQDEAAALHELSKLEDDALLDGVKNLLRKTRLEPGLDETNDVNYLRQKIVDRIGVCKYISAHYMHVDGTSFAAPIVSSVIAQLLEANPHLTPSMIREVLFSSAERVTGLPSEPQGYGIIRPRKSILKILAKEIMMKPNNSPFINNQGKTIEFYIRHDCASQIALAGSFNHWAQGVLLLEPVKNGLWKIAIPILPAGKYQYKFFVDDKTWLEDVDNPYREPDGYHGFNSILIIDN